LRGKIQDVVKEFKELQEKLQKLERADIRAREEPKVGQYIVSETTEELEKPNPEKGKPPIKEKTGKVLVRTYGHIYGIRETGLEVERIFQDFTTDMVGITRSVMEFGAIPDELKRIEAKEYEDIKNKVIGRLQDEPKQADHKGH